MRRPSRVHTTSRRHLLVVIGLVWSLTSSAALVPFGSAASAQEATNQLAELTTRNRELDTKIAAEDAKVVAAEAAAANLARDLQRSSVQIELVADEFARLVDSRREPATTRVAFAIDAYVRGDPLLSSIIEELLTLTSRSDDMMQREYYRTIVRDADDRLAAIDQQLRDIAKRVESEQAASKKVRDQLAGEQEKRRVAAESRQKFAAERADVIRQIEEINARASRAIFTGITTVEDQNRPALVIKIDNVEPARPQTGFNQADVVFEEEVEGGLTRLAAVFHSRGADPVGPIRSVRTTDIHLFSNMNKPLFSSSGGNAGTRAALVSSSLVDVGPTEYPDAYYRDGNRIVPHNYYSRTTDIRAAATGQGARPPALFSFRAADAPRPATAIDATGVDISFGATRVGYTWNGRGWVRTQNGTRHVDSAGVVATPTNVIVAFTQYGRSSADENSPEAIVTGSGEAWVLTNGYAVRGTWTRRSDTAVTTYTDERGNPIALTPGTTWIELPRPGGGSLR